MINYDKFISLYNLGYNDKQICEKLNTSPNTIGRLRKKLNLPVRTLINRYSTKII